MGRTRSVDLTEYLTHAKAVGVSTDTDVSRDVGRVVAALMREDSLSGPGDVSTLLPSGPVQTFVYVRRVSIFTEADTLPQLHDEIRDAVRCHFDDGQAPKVVRLHFVREELLAV